MTECFLLLYTEFLTSVAPSQNAYSYAGNAVGSKRRKTDAGM